MAKTAEQAVHDALWQIAVSIVGGGNVYDNRPMTEVSYPFVDLEEFATDYGGTKNGTTATVTASLNIWDTEDQRKSVSNAGSAILVASLKLQAAFGYPVCLRVSQSGTRLVQDRSVAPPVWRCMVNLVFEI